MPNTVIADSIIAHVADSVRTVVEAAAFALPLHRVDLSAAPVMPQAHPYTPWWVWVVIALLLLAIVALAVIIVRLRRQLAEVPEPEPEYEYMVAVAEALAGVRHLVTGLPAFLDGLYSIGWLTAYLGLDNVDNPTTMDVERGVVDTGTLSVIDAWNSRYPDTRVPQTHRDIEGLLDTIDTRMRSEVETERRKSEHDLKDLNHRLAEAYAQIEELKRDEGADNAKLTLERHAIVKDLNSQIDDLTKKLAISNTTIDDLRQQNKALTDKVEQLTNGFFATNHVMGLNKQIEDLEQQVRQAIADQEYLKERIRRQAETILSLNKDIKTKTDEAQEHSSAVTDARHRADKERTKGMEALEQMRKQYEQTIADIKKAHAQEMAKLTEEASMAVKAASKMNADNQATLQHQLQPQTQDNHDPRAAIERYRDDSGQILADEVSLQLERVTELIGDILAGMSDNDNLTRTLVERMADSFDQGVDALYAATADMPATVDDYADILARIAIDNWLAIDGWVNRLARLTAYARVTRVGEAMRTTGLKTALLGRLMARAVTILGIARVTLVVPNLLVDDYDPEIFEPVTMEPVTGSFGASVSPRDYRGKVFDMQRAGYVAPGIHAKPQVKFY